MLALESETEFPQRTAGARRDNYGGKRDFQSSSELGKPRRSSSMAFWRSGSRAFTHGCVKARDRDTPSKSLREISTRLGAHTIRIRIRYNHRCSANSTLRPSHNTNSCCRRQSEFTVGVHRQGRRWVRRRTRIRFSTVAHRAA